MIKVVIFVFFKSGDSVIPCFTQVADKLFPSVIPVFEEINLRFCFGFEIQVVFQHVGNKFRQIIGVNPSYLFGKPCFITLYACSPNYIIGWYGMPINTSHLAVERKIPDPVVCT